MRPIQRFFILLWLALFGAGHCGAQLLAERPSFATSFVAPWVAGGFCIAGESTLMLCDSGDLLNPASRQWRTLIHPISALHTADSRTIAGLENGRVLLFNAAYPFETPAVFSVSGTATSISSTTNWFAVGSDQHVRFWEMQGDAVVGTRLLEQPVNSVILHNDLVYCLWQDSLKIYQRTEEDFILLQQQPAGPQAHKIQREDNLLFVLQSSGMSRISLNPDGTAQDEESWITTNGPSDLRTLSPEAYVVTRPATGLQRIDWPLGGTVQTLPGRPYSPTMTQIHWLDEGVLAIAEAEQGCGLYQPQGLDNPAALGRISSAPLPLEVKFLPLETDRFWMLDSRLGWRQFMLPTMEERRVMPYPRPVIGGDLRGIWAGAVTANAGLRFYAFNDSSYVIKGVHSTDPIIDVAISAELLLAYVTASGFVAIKEINPSPYTIFHHGTINLPCEPSLAFWSGNQFFLGAEDGRLFHVDVSDVNAPVLRVTHQFSGPVRDAEQMPPAAIDRWVIAAGNVQLLELLGNQGSMISRSVSAQAGSVISVAAGDRVAFATENPAALGWFPQTLDNPLGSWDEVASELSDSIQNVNLSNDGSALLQLSDGRMQLHDWGQTAVGGPVRVPANFDFQLAPNPFNPQTRLSFTLKTGGKVELSIFNIQGQLIAAQNQTLAPGAQQINLDTRAYASGVYILRLNTPEGTITKRALMLK